MERLTGLQPVAVFAQRWQVSHRCAKRRLKNMNDHKKLGKMRGKLLIQHDGDSGPFYVDCAIAEKFMPGLVAGDGLDPLERLNRKVDSMLEVLVETRDAACSAQENIENLALSLTPQ